MADSNKHEERRMILKRPKKWTNNGYSHGWDPTVCQYLENPNPQEARMTYIECLRMQEQIRQWEELERHKTTTSARGTPPLYYEGAIVPPLPPPDAGWAQIPESSSNVFDLPAMFMTLLPVLAIWMLVVLCILILECRRARKPASVQRRAQGVQTTPLLPGGNNDDRLPPYSECEHSSTNKNEEPPPPYSACFLEPKEAEPLEYSRTQNVLDERAQPSTDADAGKENGLRTVSLATSSDQSGDVAPGSKTKVVE